MDKQETIDAIQKAMSIKDISERAHHIQKAIDSFESFLRGCFEPNNNHTTPYTKITAVEPARAGGQRAIPPNILPEVDALNASGFSLRQIANALAEDHGLSVHRTTVRRAINREGIYAGSV